jgi:putative PEP-CTERM system histidine kinase
MPAAEVLFGLCGATYVAAAAAALLPRLPGRSNIALAGACTISAGWAAVVAADPRPLLLGPAAAFDFLRAGAWFGYILVLTRRATGEPRAWRGGGLLALLFGLSTVLCAFVAWRTPIADGLPSLVSLGIDARLAFALGNLLLIENLYRNASQGARWHIILACIGIAGIFVYEILLYADTVLYRGVSPQLFVGQALVNIVVVPLLLVAAQRQRRWKEDVGVSRSVVFYTATLVLGGVFLVGLAAVGEVFRRLGADWGMLAEASLLFGGCITIAVLATSGSARSQLRSLVVDHFFARRYDYQREWTRCIATLSAAGSYVSLYKRVIRALADIVDSPGGVLFLRESPIGTGPAPFRFAGSWNAPQLDGAIVNADHALLAAFHSGNTVATAASHARPWLGSLPDAWLAIALSEGDDAVGFILLMPPRGPFRLDHEVFDLLAIVGREIALFIAEQRATKALVEARQFVEAGRRFAFIAHDIKNVAGQLSLLLDNAQRNLDNPEFRSDMLTTVRSSVQKISALLARMQGSATQRPRPLLSPRRQLEAAVAASRAAVRAPILLDCNACDSLVEMDEASFDAVIRHLVDNAIEASPPGVAIRIRLFDKADHIVIEVKDQGRGMDEEFLQGGLFRPFSSTKPAGFGLGAFQARELLREVGGDLTATSALGRGTTMRVTLPRAVHEASAPLALTA